MHPADPTTRYPLTSYPYARDSAEEDYFRAVHYLASAIYLFEAGDEALRALRSVWQVVVARRSTGVRAMHERSRHLARSRDSRPVPRP